MGWVVRTFGLVRYRLSGCLLPGKMVLSPLYFVEQAKEDKENDKGGGNYPGIKQKIPLPVIEAGYEVTITEVKKAQQQYMRHHFPQAIRIVKRNRNMRKVGRGEYRKEQESKAAQ